MRKRGKEKLLQGANLFRGALFWDILLIFLPILLDNFEFSTLAMISINVGVFGGLSMFGVYLDPLAMCTTLMSIGFSVDFTAHISYHYYRCPRTWPSDVRLADALRLDRSSIEFLQYSTSRFLKGQVGESIFPLRDFGIESVDFSGIRVTRSGKILGIKVGVVDFRCLRFFFFRYENKSSKKK